ncbi:MAG: PilZ domain-containing protein [Acidobacteria bacterium]|nr:MAG: PilZ domain-containing protein [Acidobacteriota bacterium]
MSEEGIGSVGNYLKPGLAVSLQEESGEPLAATIEALSPRSISLKFARPTPEPSFQSGDRVWMKYWDEGATVYRWETRVAEIQGAENQKVVLSISNKEVLVQRRKSYRIRLQIPFSLTVVDAVETKLIGAKAPECATKDVSVAGLAFNTDLSLEVGDKLALCLKLDPSQQVNAVGWVVRSEPSKREEYQHGVIITKRTNFVAVNFLQLNAEEQNQLLRFLRSKMSE